MYLELEGRVGGNWGDTADIHSPEALNSNPLLILELVHQGPNMRRNLHSEDIAVDQRHWWLS